jgi:hypothetical protein
MGRQYNKLLKRKRRAGYLKRKAATAKQKKAAKAPAAPAAA